MALLNDDNQKDPPEKQKDSGYILSASSGSDSTNNLESMSDQAFGKLKNKIVSDQIHDAFKMIKSLHLDEEQKSGSADTEKLEDKFI